MLIDLFIKAGWYTVPLKGKLTRLQSGKKTVPNFPYDWLGKFSNKFNTKRVKLASVLTGKLSGIIALDCDNEDTYQIFKQLDPDYKFHFISKDKPEGGGTIIYKYTPKISTFRLQTNQIQLEVYSDNAGIYLPLENNKTKESWNDCEQLPELKQIPPAIFSLLKIFKEKIDVNTKPIEKTLAKISSRLEPLVKNFVEDKKYDPILFKILTPFSFRDLPIYIEKGHLHPNDVPKGRAMEYLSKVSAILGADISISIELYINTMSLINSLWKGVDRPKGQKEFKASIINPMINKQSRIDNKPIWQYDQHWKKMGFIATTTNGDLIESFYDDIKNLYILVNTSVPYVKIFTEKRGILSMLRSILGLPLSELKFDSTKQIYRSILAPHLEFGKVVGTDKYNLFRQTKGLIVLNDPTKYTNKYKEPTTILKYLKSFVPDDFMRNYILSFLKTKLTTFKYSPVILYFIGMTGSGKDTFVNIIRQILGTDYIAKPESKVFLEQYNGWLINKYFIQLDEYGNKLTRISDKQEVLGKLKAYTGAPILQIRAMRQDGYDYEHSSTFILTANNNPLPIELDDRRFCLVRTPNKLSTEKWVYDMGGISSVIDRINEEIIDFCFYLATQVQTLSLDNYVTAPETEDKERLIVDNIPASQQIVYYMKHEKYAELKDLAIENGVIDFAKDWEKGRLLADQLEKLYLALTDNNGSNTALIKAIRSAGFKRLHTTSKGVNIFFYGIEKLHYFVSQPQKFKSYKPKLKGLNEL